MSAMKSILLTSLVILISNLALKAHATDQITYVFDQKMAKLTIHLTPKGAMDLIQNLQPELLQEEVLYLNAYQEAYTHYFNQTIDFKINGEKINFIFSRSDLNQHDATIEFQLEGLTKSSENFNLSINSFTEIYRRVQNHILINSPFGQRQFLLTKANQICSIETLETQELKSISNKSTALTSAINNYFWIGGFLLIGLGMVLFVFEIKIFQGLKKSYYT